jgi:NADH dehydrogenase, FAD-containing subunit
MNNIPEAGTKERLVIVGGGFAGLQLAHKINRSKYQVVMIDKNNYYQFQPLFYQVATAGLDPSSISYPLRKSFQKQQNFHFRMCEALCVHPEENRLDTTMGSIVYDHLVITIGCDTNFFGNEELRETTFSLKSVSESLLLRNRLLLSFEEALNEKDEHRLKEMLTFVVIGGGATGVELAGALADMKKSILPKDYPELDFKDLMEIHLVDAAPRLLCGMSEKSSRIAAETLIKRGVILHQDVAVEAYDKPYVKLVNGTELVSQNVLWVAGVTPNKVAGISEDSYMKGRLLLNDYCQVKGYDNIYAAGDNSLLISEKTPFGHPQVAQVALQMAKLIAKNLNGKAKGKKTETFSYVDKGSLATIGCNAAVADLGKFRFGGRVAWFLWLFVHIMSIVGVRNRVSVFIDWAWNYFNYDVSLRLYIRPKHSSMYKKETSIKAS